MGHCFWNLEIIFLSVVLNEVWHHALILNVD